MGPALHGPQTSAWYQVAAQTRGVCLSLVVTDTLLLQDQDLTMSLGGISGYSHQAVPHYPRVSSSASLYCAQILLLLLHFFHPESLGIWVRLRSATADLCSMTPGRGCLGSGLPTQAVSPVGSSSRCSACLGCVALDSGCCFLYVCWL